MFLQFFTSVSVSLSSQLFSSHCSSQEEVIKEAVTETETGEEEEEVIILDMETETETGRGTENRTGPKVGTNTEVMKEEDGNAVEKEEEVR